MIVCGISDIHGELIDIPKCDVLCICGDIVGLNDQRSLDASKHWWYNKFTKWVNRLQCDKVIFIPGNHDFFIEDAYKKGYLEEVIQEIKNRTNDKAELLVDKSYIYKGVKFYGCPWIDPIPFQYGKWAFEEFKEEEELNESHYSKIPNDVDILLTHDNPYKNHSLYHYFRFKIAHLFGHWHDGQDKPKIGQYNCSILNDMYNHKKGYKPITIEFMTLEEKNKIEEELLFKLLVVARAVSDTENAAKIQRFIKEAKPIVMTSKELFEATKKVEEDEIPLPITGDIVKDDED